MAGCNSCPAFLTFSLALQTFLLFLTHLSPFCPSFFSYFLRGFHSFFPFLIPSVPTDSLPFLISSLLSLLSFSLLLVFVLFSALSLTFLFLPLIKGATSHPVSLYLPACFWLPHGSLFSLLSPCLHLCSLCSALFADHVSVSALYYLSIFLFPPF